MSDFFNRYWKLKFESNDGSFKFDIDQDQFGNSLRVVFDIGAAADFRYYSGTIKIYNLDRNKRKQLSFNLLLDEFGTGPRVQLIAGYQDRNGAIFNGAINRGFTIREPQNGDFITNLQVGIPWNGNKEVTVQGIDVQSSTLKSLLFSEVERLISQQGTIGIEKAEKFRDNFDMAIDKYLDVGNVKNKSLTYHGSASKVLEEIAQEFNLIFFMDGGRFNVTSGGFKSSDDVRTPITIPPGNTAPEKIITRRNGLIGSPIYTDTGARAVSYLQPDFRVFQLVRVESEVLTKNFSITDLRFTGDTHGDEWYSEFDGTNFNQFAR